jgi:hypothetical protein
VILGLALVAAACSSGGSDRAAKSSPDDSSQGGPTTSTVAGSGTTGTSPVKDDIRIEVLSSQPDRVTGDDARIRVVPARGGSVSALRVTRDGTDVTTSLHEVNGGLEGVVHDFIEGNNTLLATGGGHRVVQRVRAWPITGPVISGPHLPLLACSTEENGLGAPTDADCSAPTKVTWHYIGKDQKVHPLTSLSTPPADIATATIDGNRVPLYVRYEKGVINRSVYEVASVDATPGDEDPTGPGWNHKLMYRYGGGCGTTYGQGTSLTTALDATYLAKGYALATSTFNTFQVQCNDVLSAETTMMVKERVIEEFGVPEFTIGEGASGGTIQLHLIAQNYPGLVDGIVAELPFPDALSVSAGVADCGLLLHYYATAAGQRLSDAQQTAINGHATTGTCRTWRDTFLGGIDPTDGCDPKIPRSRIYDPKTNRRGVRCTLQDANANQFGIDSKTGFANRPLDNVGIQYGLQALDDHKISFDQFLALNRSIGGYDIDGHVVAQREAAEPEVVLHAYETGRVANGGGDLLQIPIIDINVFTDPAGDIHDRFRAFSLRDRLARGPSPESAPGFQIWTRDPGDVSIDQALANVVTGGGFTPPAVDAIDRWLTALRKAGGDRTDALHSTRPADAVDNCLPKGAKKPIGGVGIYERKGPCRDDFPIAGDPRTAAGEPRRDDIIKCQLKPVDPGDYAMSLTSDDIDRLRSVFPDGVCDWSQAGVGETVPAMTDRSYDDVPTPNQDA